MLIILLLLFVTGATFGQEYTDDPGHKMFATVLGVKFSVPKGFDIETQSDLSIAFMGKRKYNIAEFVAVSKVKVDKEYLSRLGDALAKQMYPKQSAFRWKFVGDGEMGLHKSKFQTTAGDLKGINDASGFVEVSYVVLNIRDQTIVTGYVTGLGDKDGKNPEAKFLFGLDTEGGASMPGLYALAHIIASITGEKYTDINPGIELIGTPGSH